MTDVVLRNRDIDSGIVSPDRFGRPLVLGEIALVAWASASNPTDEVIDQSGAQLVSLNALGVTLDLTNGTLEAPRDGRYEFRLELFTVSSASASGVMEFFAQKNTAALSTVLSCKLLQPDVAANFMYTGFSRVLSLVKGDKMRCVVTGSVGGIITVARGCMRLMQVSDSTAYTPS